MSPEKQRALTEHVHELRSICLAYKQVIMYQRNKIAVLEDTLGRCAPAVLREQSRAAAAGDLAELVAWRDLARLVNWLMP